MGRLSGRRERDRDLDEREHVFSETEVPDVDVEGNGTDCVVVHCDGGVKWMWWPMGLLEKWALVGNQRCHCEVGTGLGPPEGGQASTKLEWMEELKDAVVVVLEPMEAAWTLEEMVSQ